jgi:Cu-Zn family superoxide dismutase
MNHRATRILALCTASILFTAIGCDKGKSSTATDSKPSGATTQPTATAGKTVIVTITSAKAAATQPANQTVTGTVTFTQSADGVKVVADLTGLAPGKHGIHIHEKTDMSDPGLMSLGAHWDPDMHMHHGGTMGDMRHGGDLGNLEADASGKAHLDETIAGLTIGDGGKHDIVGHSVVVHAKEDDLKTNPSGNSGGRVAAGVIEAK